MSAWSPARELAVANILGACARCQGVALRMRSHAQRDKGTRYGAARMIARYFGRIERQGEHTSGRERGAWTPGADRDKMFATPPPPFALGSHVIPRLLADARFRPFLRVPRFRRIGARLLRSARLWRVLGVFYAMRWFWRLRCGAWRRT